MRLLSVLRCARCRCRSSKAQQLGFLLVHVAILAVSGSGHFVGIAWVASLAFVLACLSLALQLVRGSLTGRFSLLSGACPNTRVRLSDDFNGGRTLAEVTGSEIVAKAMAKNPDERFESMDAMLVALKRVASAQGLAVSRSGETTLSSEFAISGGSTGAYAVVTGAPIDGQSSSAPISIASPPLRRFERLCASRRAA